jgi:hypothetical protein
MTIRIGTWVGAVTGTVVLAVLAACGSDGGGDAVTPPPAPSQTVVTMGPISGFGSVVVNGVHYATDDADVKIDGAAASLGDLRVGQVIDLKGTVKGGSASADIIRYNHNLEGPVTSADQANLRFVAMGQTVLVGPGTTFGDSISPSYLDELVGEAVEVSGLINAEGPIDATRVDLWSGSGPYDVYGTATGVDAAASTFHITGLTVDYSAANVEDFPSGAPAEGDIVLATGFEFGAGGAFIATRIELRYDQQMLPGNGDQVHVEGLITRFASATDFDVAGWPVTTTSDTLYEFGTVDDLALGVRICVEGTLDAAGVLVAEQVRFRLENEIRIVSIVTAIDPYDLTALGVTVFLDASTRFEDGSTTGSDTLGLADIHTGDWVDVRGYEYPAGSGEVIATRVELLDEQAEHRMRGPFRHPAQPAFEILTVDVMTTDTTRFVLEDVSPNDPSNDPSAAEFFELPEDTLVEARGSWSGTVLTATHAIIKTCDD